MELKELAAQTRAMYRTNFEGEAGERKGSPKRKWYKLWLALRRSINAIGERSVELTSSHPASQQTRARTALARERQYVAAWCPAMPKTMPRPDLRRNLRINRLSVDDVARDLGIAIARRRPRRTSHRGEYRAAFVPLLPPIAR